MDLGAILRQAREARMLTCDELARTTRIPLRIILAMERDEWASVPGGIFTRGYLLAYAREVGLDGQALAARIDAGRASPVLGESIEPAAAPDRRRWLTALGWRPTLTAGALRWVAPAAFVFLLLGAFLAGRWSAPENMPPPARQAVAGVLGGGQVPGAVGTASTPAAPVESSHGTDAILPVTGAGQDGTIPPSSDAGIPMAAELSVTRPCWVTGLADGTRFLYRVVQPGERVQMRGSDLAFRVGDAGAVLLSLNGEQARPLGENGEVANVRITGENYRSFLAARRH